MDYKALYLKCSMENEQLHEEIEKLQNLNLNLRDENDYLLNHIKDLEALNECLNNEINKLLTNKGE